MQRRVRWRLSTGLVLVAFLALLLSAYRTYQLAVDRRDRYAGALAAYKAQRTVDTYMALGLWPPTRATALAANIEPEELDRSLRSALRSQGIDPGDDPPATLDAYLRSHNRLLQVCYRAVDAPAWRILLDPVDPICGCSFCDYVDGHADPRSGPPR